MHPYATDSDERMRITAGLAVLSVILAWVLGQGFETLHIAPPWWLDTPAVIGFFGFLVALFDRLIWRWEPLHKLRVVDTPDLQGTWQGSLLSSFDGSEEQSAALRITQTWRHILVEFETDQSRSKSTVAAITVRSTPTPEITYLYLSEPKPDAVTTMHTHRGTAQLRLELAAEELELVGEYYTGRGRQNFGSLRFRRELKAR